MPKRPCTNRAKWRLLRGKPPQPLSAHYRLDCDFGTPVLTIYREGEGDTPTYLCEVHAAAEHDVVVPARRSVGDEIPAGDAAVPPVEVTLVSDAADKSDERSAKLAVAARKPSVAAAKPSDPSPKPITSLSSAADSNATAPKPKARASDPGAPRTKSKATAAPPPKPTPPVASEAPAILATKVPPPKVNSSSKGSARDLTYGNPAKALVDETIWNLQPGDHDAYRTALREGKSVVEAAQAAGGQLAVVHRKIQEYTGRIDALLSASNATINVETAIQAVLDSETLKVIGDDAMTDEQKDAAVAQLGQFQEWLNHGLDRPTTPLKAHKTALAIADRANWGAAAGSIPNELKATYRAVYSSLRSTVHGAVPDVRDVSERLANLCAAKSDLETVLHAEMLTPDHLSIAASAATAASAEQKFAEA